MTEYPVIRYEWDEAIGLYRCWLLASEGDSEPNETNYLGVLIPDHRRQRNTVGADASLGDCAHLSL